MIIVLYGSPEHTLKSLAVRRDEVTIGSDRAVDIFLPNADPLHARLVADGPRWLLVTSAPVVINGRDVEGRFIVDAEDDIRIAGCVIAIRPMQIDAREQELITAAARDDDARLIYADWLEEHGQWDRAELLRLQNEAHGLDAMSARFHRLAMQIKKLAPALDLGWRMMVSRDDVEGCRSVTREFTCTMTWSGLEPTSTPNVRSCRGCREQVFYCATEEEAAHHARAGHCIVIDLAATRGDMLAGALRAAAHERDLDAATTSPMMPAAVLPPTMPPGMYLPATAHTPSSSLPSVGLVRCTNCDASMTTAMRFCPVCAAQR